MDATQQDGDGLYEVPMQGSEYHDMNAFYSESEILHSAATPENPLALEDAPATDSQANLTQLLSELANFAQEESQQTNENLGAQEVTDSHAIASNHGSESGDSDHASNASAGDAGYESADSYPGISFDGECTRTCEPHFLNRKQMAYRRKRLIKRLRSELASVTARLQASRRQVAEERKSNNLLQAGLRAKRGAARMPRKIKTVSDIKNSFAHGKMHRG